jgi:hypothetical protein
MPRLWNEEISRRELLRRVGGIEQVAGVRLVTLGDGNERGVRVLEFRTGSGFEFEVVVDRAMDIGRCARDGRAIGWESGVGFGGPWFGEYDELGWLRNWGGGFVTTCGLDHALSGATDTARQYHYAAKPTETHGLHGRVSNRPARLTAYGERWDGDECILFAEGEIKQAAMFGEHLLLRRRIETRVGANSFTIHDEVENIGWDPTPHIMLYHVNVGFPVVDGGAELLVPTKSVQPLGEYEAGAYRTLDDPEPDHYERVYEHDVIAEASGAVPCGIINRARQIGAYEVFKIYQLPHQFVWRMLGEGGYVVGIEPCSNRPVSRLKMREDGDLIILQPGEKRIYDLEFGALAGGAELDGFAARVNALGGV